MLDEKTKELIAIGATITANCQSCLEYHAAKARECGATPAEIQAAIEAGQAVRKGAGNKMDRLAASIGAGAPAATTAGGCGCS